MPRVVWGRRFLAAPVVVPPSMAERLNTDALAVLAVIRIEANTRGRCALSVARIAERANIGRAKVRTAIRLAESLGAIAIGEAPGHKRVLCQSVRRVPLLISKLRFGNRSKEKPCQGGAFAGCSVVSAESGRRGPCPRL